MGENLFGYARRVRFQLFVFRFFVLALALVAVLSALIWWCSRETRSPVVPW